MCILGWAATSGTINQQSCILIHAGYIIVTIVQVGGGCCGRFLINIISIFSSYDKILHYIFHSYIN
jgi:hypothetical protein